MKNPYSKVQFKAGETIVASQLRFPGSSERAIGNNGELNASSKADLVKQIAALMEVAAGNKIVTEADAVAQETATKARKEMVTAAFASQKAHKELGEVMADELYQAANREGFMRRFLVRQELAQGQFPQVRMRNKNTVATVASSPVRVESQIVRDKLYTPPEFYISARPFIEQREIAQSLGDVLEEKYIEGLEGTMVAEDRVWYALANGTVNVSNPLTTIVGSMSTSALASLRTLVNRWNIPAATWLFASDIWSDVIGDASFSNAIDPVSKHELLLTGQLGTIFGMQVVTDSFRHPEHKVLAQGEMFIVGDPINHGQYTDRGGVESQPIDGAIERIPGRGWWLQELISMVVANSRSVAKAIRT